MTLVLIEKGLVLEGWNPKNQDKQVPGIYKMVMAKGKANTKHKTGTI